MLAVVLIGCSADNSTTETLPTTPLVVPEISEELVVPPDLPNPLKPLPSATDVQDRVPEGRSDPFQPLVSGAKASVILNGVLIVGGQQRALVELSDRSGTICVGPGGLCLGQAKTEQLLPPSWSLLSIDVQRGCITLSRRGKTQAPTCMLEHKR
ncbi:MAG TPA: hypothetical protein ACN46P_08160 [Prochlorococcus sp.]|nr:hypothetical protein [Prochlorococcaceae cyanobacterium ETNP14_MAG_5]